MPDVVTLDGGPRSTLRQGERRYVPYDGPLPFSSLWVVEHEGVVHAYWNVCQHLPVPLDGGTRQLLPDPDLICMTHGARYRPSDGLCIAGPCVGRRLVPIPVRVQDDRVLLDIDRDRLGRVPVTRP